MKDTLVQQEFNRITQLVQAAVNAAGQQHRSVDEKCIRDAYQLWRERALKLLRDYPKGKSTQRWNMLTSESVRSELRALWEMLKVQGWRAVDTGTIVDLLVGQRSDQPPK